MSLAVRRLPPNVTAVRRLLKVWKVLADDEEPRPSKPRRGPGRGVARPVET